MTARGHPCTNCTLKEWRKLIHAMAQNVVIPTRRGPPQGIQMRLLLIAIVAVELGCMNPAAQTNTPAGNNSDVAKTAADPALAGVSAFQAKLKDYVAFRNKVEGTVPQLTETSDPAKIAARERALGEALIKARPNAQNGEYFVKEYMPVLIETIKKDFAKRTTAERKALIVELPKGGPKVTTNSIYPTTIPLPTFPPNLLKALPELPPELEYRILYRDLILRDHEGNYVVDVAPGVFPIPM